MARPVAVSPVGRDGPVDLADWVRGGPELRWGFLPPEELESIRA